MDQQVLVSELESCVHLEGAAEGPFMPLEFESHANNGLIKRNGKGLAQAGKTILRAQTWN